MNNFKNYLHKNDQRPSLHWTQVYSCFGAIDVYDCKPQNTLICQSNKTYLLLYRQNCEVCNPFLRSSYPIFLSCKWPLNSNWKLSQATATSFVITQTFPWFQALARDQFYFIPLLDLSNTAASVLFTLYDGRLAQFKFKISYHAKNIKYTPNVRDTKSVFTTPQSFDNKLWESGQWLNPCYWT